jgi:hypothetical protein
MKKLIALLIAFSPAIAFAQVTDADSLAARLINLGNLVVYVLISLAIVYVIFGVVKYFIAGGEDGKKVGQDVIVRGVIGLAVIFSIWGLVALLINVVGLGKSGPNQADIPTTTKLLGPVPPVGR